MADWLKVFASFQYEHSLLALSQAVATYADVTDETLRLSGADFDLTIVACGGGEFLARGEIAHLSITQAPPLAQLRREVLALQMDIFEEDGRLLKRISELRE